MADTTTLKNRIRAAVKANDNQEITGPVLQQALLDMVDELNGATETEASQRQNGDSTLQQSITAEKNRAEGVEQSLSQAINTEKTRAEGVEQSLSQAINSESQTRQSVDTQLNNLITGIKNNIDNGYVYAGIATPTTVPVSGKVFYIAVQAGTYTNFGEQVLTQGINILRYNGSTWSNQQVIGIDDAAVAGNKNLITSDAVAMSQKAVTNAIQDVYKKSNYNDGDNIIDFNTIHIITDNPEFVCVAVDVNEKILYGIKTDGQPYFGVGCPQQVKDYIDKQINKILGTDDISSTIDSLKEIEAFLKDFTNSDTLKALLDTKANKVDVVFDISAYHATGGTLATYDNLEDALGTNGENIPQSLKKGGMSVKFVQTSDNKYVRYNYLLEDATTNSKFVNVVANWQEVGSDVTHYRLSPSEVLNSTYISANDKNLHEGGRWNTYKYNITDLVGRVSVNTCPNNPTVLSYLLVSNGGGKEGLFVNENSFSLYINGDYDYLYVCSHVYYVPPRVSYTKENVDVLDSKKKIAKLNEDISGLQNELALGAVYDVSAKNPTAGPNNDGKWESLSALLSDANLNTLIPTAYRKGGMSIKFVQTSDNKYVQWRLMADSWSIDINNWSFCGDDVIVENPGWIRVVVDSERRILEGLKADGTKVFYKIDAEDVGENLLKVISDGVRWKNKNIAYFGTSVPAQGYPQIVGAKLGANVYNQAIGSSMMRCGLPTTDYINHNELGDDLGLGGIYFGNIMRSMSRTQKELRYIFDNWTDDRRKANLIAKGYTAEQVANVKGYSYYIGGSFPEEQTDPTTPQGWPSSKPVDVYAEDGETYKTFRQMAYSYCWDNSEDIESDLSMSGAITGTVKGRMQKFIDGEINTDLFVFDHFRNDCIDSTSSQYLEIPQNPLDRNYAEGAFNYLVSQILLVKPNAKIVIVGHIDNDDTKAQLGHVWEAQEIAANRWGIPLLKLWELLGIRAYRWVTTTGYWDSNGVWHELGYNGSNHVWHSNNRLTAAEYENPRQIMINGVLTWVHDLTTRMIWLKDDIHPTGTLALNHFATIIASWLKTI